MTRTSTVVTILVALLGVGCNKETPREPTETPSISADALHAPPKPVEPVVCNRFTVSTEVVGSTVFLSIDTDLPDDTILIVSVHRIYTEEGNPSDYSIDYFDEKSTVGQWREMRTIPIDDQKWESDLSAKQKEMSRLGLGFEVASISKKVTIRALAPYGQSNPGFGERNSRLTGSKVPATGTRVVEEELEVDWPLDSPPVGKSPYPNLDPLNLEIGQSYIVSRKTPLMPAHSPADPAAALRQMKKIPLYGSFKVTQRISKNDRPWYEVIAHDQQGTKIGTGWVNSTALVGQKLEANRE
jgi:hypothetical protein